MNGILTNTPGKLDVTEQTPSLLHQGSMLAQPQHTSAPFVNSTRAIFSAMALLPGVQMKRRRQGIN